MSYRINETINDFSKLVSDMSINISNCLILELLNKGFVEFLKSNRNNKIKNKLFTYYNEINTHSV